MNKELNQRASESADRLTRAGMTLSAGIMHELIAEAERLAEENAAEAGYIRFLETELTRVQAGSSAVPEQAQELGEENPQPGELRLHYAVLAGETNKFVVASN